MRGALEMKCPVCGLPYLESYDYCKDCVLAELRKAEDELQMLHNNNPNVKVGTDGTNILLRHKYGEEIYF